MTLQISVCDSIVAMRSRQAALKSFIAVAQWSFVKHYVSLFLVNDGRRRFENFVIYERHILAFDLPFLSLFLAVSSFMKQPISFSKLLSRSLQIWSHATAILKSYSFLKYHSFLCQRTKSSREFLSDHPTQFKAPSDLHI